MAKTAKVKPKPVGKPGDGKIVLVDRAVALPAERLAWLERRGYTICTADYTDDMFLILSPRASWWADDMWDMLEAVVKLREKEAVNG